jgi:hypothetical protein
MLPVVVFTFHCAKLKGALYNLKMELGTKNFSCSLLDITALLKLCCEKLEASSPNENETVHAEISVIYMTRFHIVKC